MEKLDCFSFAFMACLPQTLAAAAPAEAAGIRSRLSRGLRWGLDVSRLPFSHLHSTHAVGLHACMEQTQLKHNSREQKQINNQAPLSPRWTAQNNPGRKNNKEKNKQNWSVWMHVEEKGDAPGKEEED